MFCKRHYYTTWQGCPHCVQEELNKVKIEYPELLRQRDELNTMLRRVSGAGQGEIDAAGADIAELKKLKSQVRELLHGLSDFEVSAIWERPGATADEAFMVYLETVRSAQRQLEHLLMEDR